MSRQRSPGAKPPALSLVEQGQGGGAARDRAAAAVQADSGRPAGLEGGEPEQYHPLYPEAAADFGPGLARIRRRRWFLWIVLIVYLPSMSLAQHLIGSFEGALPVFFGWVLLLIVAAALSAVAKCPRCGNYFHVNGMTLLYLRRCLHCQLHIKAETKNDRQG